MRIYCRGVEIVCLLRIPIAFLCATTPRRWTAIIMGALRYQTAIGSLSSRSSRILFFRHGARRAIARRPFLFHPIWLAPRLWSPNHHHQHRICYLHSTCHSCSLSRLRSYSGYYSLPVNFNSFISSFTSSIALRPISSPILSIRLVTTSTLM